MEPTPENSTNDDCYKTVTGTLFPISWAVKLPNGEIKLQGMMADLLDILTEKYGKCYRTLKTMDDWGEQYPNGTWSGLIGELKYKGMDIMGSVIMTSPERWKTIPHIGWIDTKETSFIYKKPTEEHGIDKFMKPYTLQVWIWMLAFVLAIIIFATIIYILSLDERPKKSENHPPSNCDESTGKRKTCYGEKLQDSFLLILCILLGQATNGLKMGSVTFVCLMIFWLFGSLALNLSYKNNLVAMLTMPNIPIPFDTVEEFLAQDKYKTIVHRTSLEIQAMMKSPANSTGAKILQKSIMIDDFFVGLKMVEEGFPAFTGKLVFKSIISNEFKKSKTCPYYLSKSHYQQAFTYMAVSEDFPLKEEFDKDSRRLQEAGLIDYLIKKYLRDAYKCLDEKEDNPRRALRLTDFYSVFFLWATGLGISGLTFILEILCSWKEKRSL